jgi:predicted acylesterase/phospholipase RssA
LKPQSPAAPKAEIGLALAGGGFMGAVYELGALAAIEECVPGLHWDAAKAYVGVSAGAFVAAGLANHISVREMVRLFIDDDQADGFDPSRMLRPHVAELSRRATKLPPLVASAAWHYLTRPSTAMASFRRVGKALPTGLFDPAPGEKFLAKLFSQPGRSNDFRKLDGTLRVVATDLDSGEAVEFGGNGLERVPISKAVTASASLPGVFPPALINGRHYVDGALRKTLHASVPLNEGVDVLFCFNPIVPFNTTQSRGRTRKLVDAGLPGVMSQTLRSLIHSRMSVGMERYKTAYPNTEIILFEPDHGDDDLFFINIFATSGRRRLCEHAYRSTRTQLWQRRHELVPKLARLGLKFDMHALTDERRSLVNQVAPLSGRLRGLSQVTAQLSSTLDELAYTLRGRRRA